MTGPSLDLDALREKAEKATPGPWDVADRVAPRQVLDSGGWLLDFQYPEDAAYVAEASPDVILAVLARVEEQRKENERLREALNAALSNESEWREKARAALAGSPAENKEPCPACKGVGSYKRIVARRAITVGCPRCNGTGKEPS